jgi:uncharacterized membrane protein
MAAQHFFAKAWSLSFERFSKKIRDFVKNLLLIIYSVMWFTCFVYTLFWLNPSDWFQLVYFLSRDRFYIHSIKAHVIFPTPASNSRRKALARNVEILLICFQAVASLPKLVHFIGTTYTGKDRSRFFSLEVRQY